MVYFYLHILREDRGLVWSRPHLAIPMLGGRRFSCVRESHALADERLPPAAPTSPHSSGVVFDVPSADSKPAHPIESTACRNELFFFEKVLINPHIFPRFFSLGILPNPIAYCTCARPTDDEGLWTFEGPEEPLETTQFQRSSFRGGFKWPCRIPGQDGSAKCSRRRGSGGASTCRNHEMALRRKETGASAQIRSVFRERKNA
jgi:hypothetical protein